MTFTKFYESLSENDKKKYDAMSADEQIAWQEKAGVDSKKVKKANKNSKKSTQDVKSVLKSIAKNSKSGIVGSIK